MLASILARDGFLPRQLANRGDRLVFTNGIVLLAALAVALIVGLRRQLTRLIQLYIIGVFVSFTLSQAGHGPALAAKLRPAPDRPPGGADPPRRGRSTRVGAVVTALVLVIVLITKFTHGAWIVVVIAMPVLFLLMRRIRRHYDRVAAELRPEPGGVPCPAGTTPSSWSRSSTSRLCGPWPSPAPSDPDTLVALTVRSTRRRPTRAAEWDRARHPSAAHRARLAVPRGHRPVLDYIGRSAATAHETSVCVFIPEYVVGHWWEQLLHNQSALRLKARLLFQPGVMVTSVPWQLGSAELLRGSPSSRAVRGARDGIASRDKRARFGQSSRPVTSPDSTVTWF